MSRHSWTSWSAVYSTGVLPLDLALDLQNSLQFSGIVLYIKLLSNPTLSLNPNVDPVQPTTGYLAIETVADDPLNIHFVAIKKIVPNCKID